MAVRKVAVMGHPILRQEAQPVPEGDIGSEAINNLIQDMVDTMVDYNGVGLAAPQIHESLQIVVMLGDFEGTSPSSDKLICLINPEITPLTEETSSYWEGCLSVPGLRGKVARPNKIELKAWNQNRERIERTIEGFAATVVQHECDHLNGVLYVDQIEDLAELAFEKEYQRYHSFDE